MNDHKHEAVPYRTFILIWLALLALTGTTIAVSRIDLGALNIWVALGVASIKSSLVIFVFMHLRQSQNYSKSACWYCW